ncbi:AraC family transcriptional regulator [Pelagicoccus mobilis]|uniref:Helix-turn-helix domain-containing protein n=1 Tax=Pelagicoccus mobilis TaxID=415221 RepID=A0A934VPW2_9BACT|nr:AraC family transcriptional regulator [Pelagicoccus mobilis]MBK1875948.1 helix-turn-helix domain-containing protein [Pelagicoccus mobilis]
MKKPPAQVRCETEVAKLLRSAGHKFQDLSDLPTKTIADVQRGVAPGMRDMQLAKNLRPALLEEPITQDLLCTRAGHHQAVYSHYLNRPSGTENTVFIFCTRGRGWLELDGQAWPVEENDAFIVPPHTSHKYGSDPDDPWAPYWVHLQGKQAPAFQELITPSSAPPVIHLPHAQEVTLSLEQLIKAMSRVHTFVNVLAATGELSRLLTLIQFRMRTIEPRSRSAEENLDNTIEFMQQSISQKLTLQNLAKVANMSPNHFGALFLKRFNSTPIDYFNRLKIQRACELLTTTKLPVGEIADQLGYSDSFYFSRLFKKTIGVSPRGYR